MSEMLQKTMQIRHLSYAYMAKKHLPRRGVDAGEKCVLKDISLSAESGELVSILGKNGAGKSTLFKCILGILSDYDGEILLDGSDTRKMTARELSRKVAYIPQSRPQGFSYTALEMVLMGAANRMRGWQSPNEAEETAAMEALRRVGICQLWNRSFATLSGGEQQLVMMARAIMQDAGIFLMDEPLANMDYGNQIRMLQEMRELTENGYLILQTIHNPDQAYEFSDRIIAMKDGSIFCDGRPQDVLDAALVRSLYGEDISWKHDKFFIADGTAPMTKSGKVTAR